MPSLNWSNVIAASVVPVVIISACGLLCLAFYNRLASIVSRLRGFQRERLQQQEAYSREKETGKADRYSVVQHERMLDMLALQTARVTRRARLIRRTLLCLLSTIACLTLCSISLGASTIAPKVVYVAVPTFLLGMLLLLAGVLTALLEMKDALEPVELETLFVTQLEREFETLVGKPHSAKDI